ncbi:MAG TPA: AAA family ATPase, partial [bacterium]|nr:AAA family ATPase [bacterium]
MLNSLYAKNFILLDELKIAFQPGLNVITGETGAGKSILIGALSGLLGERLTKEVVRSGSDKAILEAEFAAGDLPSVREFLQQNDLDDDSVLLIRREITSSGKGRCFINDQPVPITLLQKLGDRLVDLHGQHEHQLLLQPQHHGAYLDAFLDLSASLADLREGLNGFHQSLKELHETQAQAESLKQKRDYLQFQYHEIHSLDPTAGEDDALRQEENILRHAESIFEKTHKLYAAIYEAEGSVSETLAAADSTLNELAAIDPRFQALAAECRNARIVIDELATGLRRYHEGVEVDPDRLEKIRSRLSALAGLKKKYGGDLDKVLAHQQRVRQELDLLDNLDDTLSALRKRLEEEREKLAQQCAVISQRRMQARAAFAEQVVSILSRLGMGKARFEVALHQRIGEEEPYIMRDRQPIRVTASGA